MKMSRYSNIRLDKICEGCLSIDRTLLELDEDELRMFYRFTDVKFKIKTLQLCWECRAIIRKFIKFKQQVRHAHVILNTYNLNSVPSLSNLAISKCDNIKNIFHDDKNVTSTEFCPLTFIKVEETGDMDFQQFDDDFASDLEAGEKTDLKNCIESENGQDKTSREDNNTNSCDLSLKFGEKERVECEKEKAAKYDFNESDDEPLITRRVESKKGRRKKNKDTRKEREVRSGVIINERIKKKLEKLNMESDKLQMVLLTWDEVEEGRQKALQSDNFKRHEYRCYHCAIGFNHRCKLDNHMKKHEPSAGSAECAVCRIRCKDSHALVAHRRRHRLRWRCALCGAQWSRASLGAEHVARAHGGPSPLHRCGVCGQREPTLAKLRNHAKNHAERPECELCGKSFRDRTSLRTHLFIHKGEKEYECPKCKKKFLFKKAMEVHLVTHDAPAHLYCHLCDKNFKNKMSYNQHIKYNLKHIDPAKLKYACTDCDKKFAKASRLEEHRLAVHLKATPVACPLDGCSFVCSSRTVLRTHTRMLHRAARLLRNHVCDVCGKTYATKKCLEGHLRAHSGERPFRCDSCPAAFGYQAALYNHNKLVHLRRKSGRRHTDWSVNVPQPQTAAEQS